MLNKRVGSEKKEFTYVQDFYSTQRRRKMKQK